MRRFVFFLLLCTLSLPVGLSVTGCAKDNGQNFCGGFQSGRWSAPPQPSPCSRKPMGSPWAMGRFFPCPLRLR